MAEEIGVRSADTVALCTRRVMVVYSALIHLGMWSLLSHTDKAFHLEQLQLCLVYDPARIFLTYKFSPSLFSNPTIKLKLGLQVGQNYS
jgi:hypothetical protein